MLLRWCVVFCARTHTRAMDAYADTHTRGMAAYVDRLCERETDDRLCVREKNCRLRERVALDVLHIVALVVLHLLPACDALPSSSYIIIILIQQLVS